MKAARLWVLGIFRRFERSIAWSMLALSLIAAVTILAGIWKVDDKVTAGLTALVLLWQGFEAVQQAEDDKEET